MNYRHPGPRRVWMVGSELQFTTSFPLDPLDPEDPLDPLPCRKVVFRLRETPTFEMSTSKVIATLRPFARGWPRALFFTIENEGRKREGFKTDRHSAAVCSWMAWSPVFYNRK